MNIPRPNAPPANANYRGNANASYVPLPVAMPPMMHPAVPAPLMGLHVVPPLLYAPVQYNPPNLPGYYNSNAPLPSSSSYIPPPHSYLNPPTDSSRSNARVFTNSNVTISRNYSNVNSIGPEDSVSFALPERATLREVGIEPMNREDILNLLDFTLRKSESMKSRKKRLRTRKRQEKAAQNDTELPSKVEPAPANRTEPARVDEKAPAKVTKTEPATHETELATTSKMKIEENANVSKDKTETSTKPTKNFSAPVNIVPTSPKVKKILDLRNEKYENPAIIESLKKYNILSSESPFWETPKVFTRLPPTTVGSLSNSGSAAKIATSTMIKTESATTNKMDTEENPNASKEKKENYSISIDKVESCPKVKKILDLRNEKYENPAIIESLKKYNIFSSKPSSRETPKKFTRLSLNSKSAAKSATSNVPGETAKKPESELGLKSLMQESWRDIDEDKEDANSKQIYKTLENLAISYGVNADALKKLENGSPVKKEQENGSPAKKKKKKAQKQHKLSEGTDNEQKKNDLEDDEEFDKLYDKKKIEEGLENGSLFKAVLRLNAKNSYEAYVSMKQEETDIFIEGKKNRNKALDGDVVAVELEPESKWKYSTDATSEEKKLRYKCGKVVYIFEENSPRVVIGHLRYLYGSKLRGFVLFPLRKQYPLVKITNHVPNKWRACEKIRENVLFSAKIVSWTKVKLASGEFIEDIGLENDLSTHKKCVLLENGLEVKPFEAADKYLPTLPYEIPAEELSRRKDLRDSCVFTIDPPTARDLDDALSCEVTAAGRVYEVGIHIADVTHFLTADTPLDLHARQKATSVYLVDSVFHMLPEKLCDLCSLMPGEDKLAFSVNVMLDEDANVLEHSFYKSVIRSCAKLSYHHAQAVIDGQYDASSFPPVGNGYAVSDCVDTILKLHSLAVKMRKRRFEAGALRLDQPKLTFKLDENGSPIEFSLYTGQECNWLVEEFMLLANVLVAKKIKESFPHTALLRYHSAPNEKSLTAAVENLEKVGICIDTTSAGTIFRSMREYAGVDEISASRMAVITKLLVKPMMRACYTCSVPNIENCSDFYHYALNEPFYTHFTSPIRRYADVIVHRLLAAAIYSKSVGLKPNEVEDIASNCNKKKNSAKRVSDESIEAYLRTYLESKGPLRTRAVVTDVRKSHLEILDLTTYSVCRVFSKRIKGKVEYKDDTIPSIVIEWSSDENDKYVQLVQIFTIVDVELSCGKKNKNSENEIIMELLRPKGC